MNFNIFISKQVGDYVNMVAKKTNRSENAIIKEAIEDWIFIRYGCVWPDRLWNEKKE